MARPTYQVSEKTSREVRMMAGLGVRQEDIARVLDITPKTLRKHFRTELDLGGIQSNAQVMNTLFRMAISGKNTAATIFWAKVRCGQRERAPQQEGGQLPGISVKAVAPEFVGGRTGGDGNLGKQGDREGQ